MTWCPTQLNTAGGHCVAHPLDLHPGPPRGPRLARGSCRPCSTLAWPSQFPLGKGACCDKAGFRGVRMGPRVSLSPFPLSQARNLDRSCLWSLWPSTRACLSFAALRALRADQSRSCTCRLATAGGSHARGWLPAAGGAPCLRAGPSPAGPPIPTPSPLGGQQQTRGQRPAEGTCCQVPGLLPGLSLRTLGSGRVCLSLGEGPEPPALWPRPSRLLSRRRALCLFGSF